MKHRGVLVVAYFYDGAVEVCGVVFSVYVDFTAPHAASPVNGPVKVDDERSC